MLTEIEHLIAAFIGGALGGVVIVLLMYINFQQQLKEYLFAKEGFKTRIELQKLQNEVTAIRIKIAVLYAESIHDKNT